MLLSRRNQLLLEFSFWNEPLPRKGPNIYELRTYKLKVRHEMFHPRHGTGTQGIPEPCYTCWGLQSSLWSACVWGHLAVSWPWAEGEGDTWGAAALSCCLFPLFAARDHDRVGQ